MQTFVSILRGINVSGQKKILMADLKTLYEDLQFKDVTTYIQSGNVIFKTGHKLSDTELTKQIEKAIHKKYDFEVPVQVRSVQELENIVTSNPFLKEKNIQVDKLHVTFLSEIPEKTGIESMEKLDFSGDQFKVIGKEVYLYTPGGYGETKLSNKFFETKLKTNATTRNWKTIYTLLEMATK